MRFIMKHKGRKITVEQEESFGWFIVFIVSAFFILGLACGIRNHTGLCIFFGLCSSTWGICFVISDITDELERIGEMMKEKD